MPDLGRACVQWGWLLRQLGYAPFHAGTRRDVDHFAAEGTAHGWTLLFPDRYPHVGGPDHYALYLANANHGHGYPSTSHDRDA